MKNNDEKNLVPKEDEEFEKAAYDSEKDYEKAVEDAKKRAEEERKKAREDYEKKLKQEQIELMKLKSGVIDSSEIIKEEPPQEKPKLHGKALVANIWYHDKWIILFVLFIVLAAGYIIFDSSKRTPADVTALMLCTNGLEVRLTELEEYLETFADDINGDGEVHVEIYPIAVGNVTDVNYQAEQAKLMSQLQVGTGIIVIGDSSSEALMKTLTEESENAGAFMHDFTADYPDSDAYNEWGLKFYGDSLKEKLKWQAMPEDMYIGLREPQKLLACSQEEMQRYFDAALPMIERIAQDLAQ